MKLWKKRARLERTIERLSADRVPVALWRHWPGDDQSAESMAATHVKWQRDHDWDLVKVTPSSSYCLKGWGLEDKWSGSSEGTRQITRRVISSPEDWYRLAPLDPGQGMLAEQIRALRLIVGELGEEHPVLATIFSPMAQAKNLAGKELLLEHARQHPDALIAGLRTITTTIDRFLEEAVKAGISGVYYAIQHARASLLTAADYQQFGLPFDRQILDSVRPLWLNMVHLHGEDVVLEHVKDLPAAIFNWHDRETGISLAAGQKVLPGAVSGGISRWTIYEESPDATMEQIDDAFRQTERKGLVLGVGCVIMTNTPLRNIVALRNAVDNQ